MFDKMEVGRAYGIPIVLDASLILLVGLWGLDYFASGDAQVIAYGALLVAGLLISILMHELGHAGALRFYGIPISHIELNGLGGLCIPAGHVPPDRWTNIVVLLAGPAITGSLWLLCDGLAAVVSQAQHRFEPHADASALCALLWHLASLNWWMLLFNLAPSHPLDGGRALAHLMSRWIGYDRAMRLVAGLGLLVVAWLVWEGVHGSYFAFVLAFFLFQANQQVLDTHRARSGWRRWD